MALRGLLETLATPLRRTSHLPTRYPRLTSTSKTSAPPPRATNSAFSALSFFTRSNFIDRAASSRSARAESIDAAPLPRNRARQQSHHERGNRHILQG